MVDNEKTSTAPLHAIAILELLDPRIPKTEREHAAAKELEVLREKLRHVETLRERERERLHDLLFRMGAMEHAPCFRCGYNGPGYFQPSRHPCAAQHHALYRSVAESEEVDDA